MAHLKKRGRYYSVRFYIPVNGNEKTITKSLGTRHKAVAQKMVRELEKLESLGSIDPEQPGFNPKRALKNHQKEEQVQCADVKEALNLFYEAKKHLAPASIAAYKRALDHFVTLNGIEDVDPKSIRMNHFEKVIFKRGINAATRHYYFRHFRTWWRFLKKRRIVDQNYFDRIREDLPKVRENTRPKMITEDELKRLFKVFDEELERKKTLPEFDDSKVQRWFKPVIAVYFYGGLRKHEATYSPEIAYSGIKGENLIYIDGKLSYIDLPSTKGRSERRIPIIQSLRRYLEEYLNARGPVGPDEYLFIYIGGKTKGKPVRGDRVYREFKRYAKLAKIPSTRNLHGMRHQAITQWIEDGFHTAEASYMAGHSSQKVTEKYTHLTAKHLKMKMDQLT
ncbi:MAG: tyrosine-type recombinase/integrase [Candidatus Babeliales bacterium]